MMNVTTAMMAASIHLLVERTRERYARRLTFVRMQALTTSQDSP
jgi:hypothetical protein